MTLDGWIVASLGDDMENPILKPIISEKEMYEEHETTLKVVE